MESATLTVDEIVEAAAVPGLDDIRARAVEMYVSLKPGSRPARTWRRRSRRQSTAAELDGQVTTPRGAEEANELPATEPPLQHRHERFDVLGRVAVDEVQLPCPNEQPTTIGSLWWDWTVGGDASGRTTAVDQGR